MVRKTTYLKESPDKPPRDFSLIKAIRKEKLYKSDVNKRDTTVREWVENNIRTLTKGSVLPGQLIMFNYFEPATREELEYYDQCPCTVFFGHFKTKEGEPRVLGFNLHYYPPKMRYVIIDRIFSIFKPIYEKSWNSPLSTGMSFMQYKMLMQQLEREGLDFGVREYIPNLMHSIRPIPPKDWQKVVFTEGHFKKRTREQILNYWKRWVANRSMHSSAPTPSNNQNV